MRIILLTCLLLCSFISSQAQSYSFAQYSVEDGLIQSSVSCFVRDQYDNLWIGTQAGLSRFDGHDFQNFTTRDGLQGIFVRDLELMGDSILIATNLGLNVFDGQQFHVYEYHDESGQLLSPKIIFRQQGKVYLILGNNTLAKFDGRQIRRLDQLEEGTITGVSQDRYGVSWFCTIEGGVYTLEANRYVEQIGPGEHSPRLTDLVFDKQNRLWLTSLKDIWTYDFDARQLQAYEMDLGGTPRLFMMQQDKEGFMWVGTDKGVFSFDPLANPARPEKHLLSDVTVTHIYLDNKGELLLGTPGDGFYLFRGRLFSKLTQEEGLGGKSFMSLYKDSRGIYWFGSYGGGLSVLDGQSIINYNTSNGLVSDFVGSIVEDSLGNIWLSTIEGLQVYDPVKKAFTRHYTHADGVSGKVVYTSARGEEGSLLFGTRYGLLAYEQGRFKAVRREGYEKEKGPVVNLLPWKDRQFFFADEADIYLLRDGVSRKLITADRLGGDYITGLSLDPQQDLWITTLNGQLYQYEEESDSLHNISQQLQLPQMVIYSLVFAEDGSLLLGTQRGVRRIFFGGEKEKVRLQQYNREDGFLGVECNTNAVLKDEGSVWFGTVNGVYKFDPDEESRLDEAPRAYMTGIKLFYEEVDWKRYTDSVSKWYDIPYELNLPYKANHLVFNYKAVSLTYPKELRYSYRLLGLEEAWSPPTDRSEAVYANIPPGEYTFQVRAASDEGAWYPSSASFSFAIEAPFWQSWWFYLLVMGLAFLLVRLYIFWRLRLEREHRVKLELEVRKRTREIKALNNSLEERVKDRTAELELSNRRFEVEFELRKLDQEKLALQEREYRQLVNNVREVIFKTDTEGNLIFLNHPWQEYMGYHKAESRGHHFSAFVDASEEEKKNYWLVFKSIIGREMPHFEAELRMKRKDGSNFWAKVSVRIEYDEDGHIIGTYGSLVDIDQRKKAEFKLRASEDRYKFLIENTQDIITLQSADQHYSYASPRIYEVAGIDPKELLGKKTIDFLHPEDLPLYLQMKEEAVRKGSSKGVTVRFQNGDGEYRWYETFLKPILNEDGELQSFITSSRDVTEKVELSREIEKVRKKVAQDFHDEMGNNLASISVLSQIIIRKLNGHGEVSALLSKIDVASKNLFHGARDFIWAIDPKNDNLKEVYFNLKDFGEDLFENTGISFYASLEQVEQGVSLKLPSGWSRQLVLIFKEALTNVLKYAACQRVNLHFCINNQTFRIELSDDGRGFQPEVLSKSRGISNMQDRTKKMKAQIVISSAPGRGTRIVFTHKIPHFGVVVQQAV